ncbi:MAG: FeS assembly protein SufD [Gammaproteobacteria bacterium]|nr:FeS assembly protein SufD [Gammaproteobacteria bacterium]
MHSLMDSQQSIIKPELPLFGENLSEINALRSEAWKSFFIQGWPDRKYENWKYTDLSKLFKHYQFKALHKKPAKLPSVQTCPGTYQLVMLDGEFCPELSLLPQNIEIMSLKEALRDNTQEVLNYLEVSINYKEQPMLALNQALMSDGIWINIPAQKVLDKPLQIIYMHSEQREPVAVNYRNIIKLGAGSRLNIIEEPQSQGRLHVLLNTYTQVFLEKEAKIEFIGLQRDLALVSHISNLSIEQKQLSHARLFNLALGCNLGRYDLQSYLLEPEAECDMNGAYILTRSAHTDFHTRVDHLSSHTYSREIFKGVLDEKARGVFNGKVVVHPKIKAVDARQANHNLLLANSAEIDCKPELEIYSDDVKCSHGATVGQLDEQALFYCQSRGIDLQTARLMLIQAFVLEMLEHISNDLLKLYLQNLTELKIQQHFAKELL